nr:hypothetical protein [uncultured Blautia sp.]
MHNVQSKPMLRLAATKWQIIPGKPQLEKKMPCGASFSARVV